MDGTNFVEKIDLVLKEKGLKRQPLADYCGITTQAITDWSKRGAIPGVYTVLKIADFLSVSIEWLVRDDYESTISNYNDTETDTTNNLSSSAIMHRVEAHVMYKFGRTHSNTDEELYESILDIMSMDEIRAFWNNRAVPSFRQLYMLATRLDLSIDWLLRGKNDENLKTADIPIYRLAIKYRSHLTNFYCLHESDQKIVEDLTSKLFDSRLKIREKMQSLGIDAKKIPEVWPEANSSS